MGTLREMAGRGTHRDVACSVQTERSRSQPAAAGPGITTPAKKKAISREEGERKYNRMGEVLPVRHAAGRGGPVLRPGAGPVGGGSRPKAIWVLRPSRHRPGLPGRAGGRPPVPEEPDRSSRRTTFYWGDALPRSDRQASDQTVSTSLTGPLVRRTSRASVNPSVSGAVGLNRNRASRTLQTSSAGHHHAFGLHTDRESVALDLVDPEPGRSPTERSHRSRRDPTWR